MLGNKKTVFQIVLLNKVLDQYINCPWSLRDDTKVNNKICALIHPKIHHIFTHLCLLVEETYVVCLIIIH